MSELVKSAGTSPTLINKGETYQKAVAFLKSGLAPVHIKTPEQAIIIAAKGQELGIPFFASMSSFYVIGNQAHPTCDIKLALALKSGLLENFILTPGQNEYTASVKRKDIPSAIVIKFGIKEANEMGLTGKDNYKKQPMTMYRTRALDNALDLAFADIFKGLTAAPSEILDESLPHPVLENVGQLENVVNPVEAEPIPEPFAEPEPEPVATENVDLVFDIRDKLGAMNGGEIDAMNAHLKKLTTYKAKTTGETKFLTLDNLPSVAMKRPQWLETIHKKVLEDFNREFRGPSTN